MSRETKKPVFQGKITISLFGLKTSCLANTHETTRYWAYKNAESIDGLPGLELGRRTAKEESIAPIKKMVGMTDGYRSSSAKRFSLLQLVFVALVAVVSTAVFITILPFLGVRLLATLPTH